MAKRKNVSLVSGVTGGAMSIEMLNPHEIQMDLEKNRKFGMDKESLESFAKSLQAEGVLEPIIVQRKGDGTLWVVAGHRRCAASRLIPDFKVPAIVKPEMTEEQEFILKVIENEQREDASPVDRAISMSYAKETLGWNQNKIAEVFNCYPADVSRDLSLLRLPKKIQTAVHKGKMTMKDALLVLKESKQKQEELETEIDNTINEEQQKGSSDPETRRRVGEKVNPGKQKPKTPKRVNVSAIEPKDEKENPKLPDPQLEGEDYVEDPAPLPTSETSIRLQMLAKILDLLLTLEDSKDKKVAKVASQLIDFSESDMTKEQFLASI